ncbi:hypothetical protein [Nocardioides sp.]|uniref:hypothetical protein n=1 Tax=Nocardioides sp. TaxID=35761 RepID=UPI003D129820
MWPTAAGTELVLSHYSGSLIRVHSSARCDEKAADALDVEHQRPVSVRFRWHQDLTDCNVFMIGQAGMRRVSVTSGQALALLKAGVRGVAMGLPPVDSRAR